MTQAIVHIGFNKCGSTALQKWLSTNQGALAKEGFAYRRTDPRDDVVCTNPQFSVLAYTRAGQPLWPRRMNEVLGIDLADPASQQRVADTFARDYLAWVSEQEQDVHSVLISNESLGPRLNTPELVAGLDGWLTEHFDSARYVAYIREPVAWTISLFGHSMRRGMKQDDLADFAKRRQRTTFGRALRAWSEVVPAERLDVRLFDEAWLSGSGLVEDFCGCAGIDTSRVPMRMTLENRSFAKSGLLARLGLTRRLKERPEPAPDAAQMIRDTNKDDMHWIQTTFFGSRESDFQNWLTGKQPSRNRRRKTWQSS